MSSGVSSKKLPPPPVHYFKTDGTPVTGLNFLTFQNETFLAQGSQDGNLTVWDLKTCESRWSVSAHSAACRTVLQLDSGQVVTQGRNEAVRLWDVDAEHPVASVPFTHHGFCRVALVGGRLACPTEPASEVALLDLRCGPRQQAARLVASAELGTVMALAADAAGRLAAVYETGALLLWQPAQPRLPVARLQLTAHTPMCLDVSAAGRGLVGTSGPTVASFSVSAAGGLTAGPAVPLSAAGVASVRLRPTDGRLAALGCWDGRLRLASGRRLRLLAALDHHTACVECVQFAPRPVRLWNAGALLASGSADGSVALWKVYDDA